MKWSLRLLLSGVLFTSLSTLEEDRIKGNTFHKECYFESEYQKRESQAVDFQSYLQKHAQHLISPYLNPILAQEESDNLSRFKTDGTAANYADQSPHKRNSTSTEFNFIANRPYIGASGGFGNINSSREPFIIKSGLINQVKDQPTFLGLLSVNPKNSGLSGRLYTGIVAGIFTPLAIGAEVGYSYYKFSSVYSSEDIAYDPYADFKYYDKIKNSGFGIDILANTSVSYKRIVLAMKAGFQYAIQKGNVYSRLTATEQGQAAIDLPLRNAQFKKNRMLPEILFQAKWRLLPSLPIYIGFSYQYVFGEKPDNAEDNQFNQVNSRQMATLDIELLGW